MIYHPKPKSTYFHHCWETWHHVTSSQLPSGCLQGRCSNDVDTAFTTETKIRQADGILNFIDLGVHLLVSVDQTTRQKINYFYVNEAISKSHHRGPAYQFQLAMVSFTAYCVLFAYYNFYESGIGGPWL